MSWKNPGEAWAWTIRFLFVHYQHPPWSSVSIGKPPPKSTNEPFFVYVDGDLAGLIKHSASDRLGDLVLYGSSLDLSGFFFFLGGGGTGLTTLAKKKKKKNETAENHDVDRTLFDRVIPCSITNDRRPTQSHWTRFSNSPCTRDWAHRTAFSLRHDSRLSQFFWPG